MTHTIRAEEVAADLPPERVLAAAYGANLLGAMVGGVAEYMSLVTGFQMLLIVVAGCYLGALAARPRS